eukprot:g1229.t1
MYSPTLAIMLRCAFLCRLFFLLGTVRSFASGAFLPPKVIFPGDTVRILIPSTAANGLQNSASFVRLVARAVGASGSSSTSGSGEDVVLASSTSSSSGNGNLVELEVPSAGALQPFLTSAFSFRFAHLLVGATTATSEALVTVASREILFLETDKAIYKPGEVVRFRAVAMDRVSGKPLSLMPLPAPETSGGALLQAEVEVRKIVSESEQLLIANLRTSPTNSSALFGVFDDAEELQFPLPPTIISIGATTSAEQRQSARDTYSAQAKLLYANATSSQREVLARSNLLSYVVEEYVLPTFSVALALKEEAPTIVSQETEAGAIKGFVSASYTYGGEAKCKNDKILVEVIKKCPVWSSWWGIGPVVWRGGMPEIAFLRRNRKRGRRRAIPDRTAAAASLREVLRLERERGNVDAIRLVANCTDIASGETRSSDSIEIKYASTAVRVTSDPEFQPGLPFHVLVEDLTAFVKTSVEGYHSGAAAAAAGGADVKLVVESSHYHHSVQPRYVEIDLAPFLDEVASSGTATSSRKLKTLESKLFTVPLPPERDASCCDLSALSAASGDLYAWSTEKIRCCVQSVRAYVTVDGVQVTTAAAARSGAANAREDSHTACATRKYSLRGHYATAGKLVSTGGSSGAAVPQADSLFFSAQDRAVSLLTADSNLLSGSVVATHRTTTSGGIMAASSTSSSLGATSSSSAMMCREFYDEARIFDQLGALRADSLSGAAVPLSACAPILPTGYCPTSSSSSPYTRSGNDMAVTMDVAVMESAAAPTMAAGASASAGAGTTSGGAEQAADVLSVAAQSKLRTFFPETWLWRGVDVLDAATASAAADDALSSLTDSQSQSQSAASSSNSSLLRATVPDSLTAWDLRGFAVHPVVGLGTDVSLPSLTVAKPVVAGVRAPYVITRGEMVALRGSVAAHLRGVAGDDSENGDVSADLECTWRIGVSAGLRFEDPLNKYNTVGVGLPSPSATGEVDDDNYGAGKIVQSYELKAAKTVAKTGAIAFALPVSTSAGRTSVLKPSKVRLEAYCALKAAGGSGSSSFSSVIARVAYVDRLERSVLVRPEGVRKLKRTNLLLTTTSSDGGATWTSPSETVPLTWRDNQNVAGDDFNSSSPQDEAVVVADSKRLTIAITGELLSQTIANIERLVRVPYGCGEQNLISLAPNVYVFRYLASRTSYFSSRGPPGAALKKRLFSNMRVGYVRQLRYKSSSDGGFSAYGEGAGWGTFEGSSLWLTAFSLRVFADVGRAGYTGTSLLAAGSNDLDRSKHMNKAPSVSIDWPNLAPAVRFILNSQSSSGDFLNRGRVFSSSMKGSTAGSRLSLTSFVTLTLCSVWRELNRDYFGSAWIEGENDTPPEHVVAAGALILVTTMRDVTRAIRRASSWVKQSRGGQSDSVSARILSLYALLRAGETASADFPAGKVLGSEAASEVLLLKKLDTEGLYYWEDGPEVDAATTSSTSSGVPGYYFRSDPNSEPSAASIELTAYAVLALVAAGDSNNAYSGVKWLLKHRSEAGGFRSTQDTVVALEAIAEFQLQMALSSATIFREQR